MKNPREKPWHVKWLVSHGFSRGGEGEWVKDDTGALQLKLKRVSKERFSAYLCSLDGWAIEDASSWNTPEEAVNSILKKKHILEEEISSQKSRISKLNFI